MRKITVLFFTTSLNTVGPAKALVNIATNLDNERFRIVFCQCVEKEHSALYDVLAQHAIPVYSLGARGPVDLRTIFHLVKILHKEGIDILHSRLARADFFARLAGLFARKVVILNNVSYIYSDHFTTWHRPVLGRLYAWADRQTLRWATWYVANSDGVRRDLIDNVGMSENRVSRIFNGIDVRQYACNSATRLETRRQLGVDTTDFVVGTVANLTPFKGLHYLVECASLVLSQNTRFVFLIAGEGSEKRLLETQIDKLGLQEKVRLLGQRSDIPDFLAALDLFVFPSVSEGHPNALIEAMAVGLPVVASDIAGVNEMIEQGTSGILVPSRNPKALAKAILALSQNAQAKKNLGKEAKKAVESKVNIGNVVPQFEKLYESLWSEKQMALKKSSSS